MKPSRLLAVALIPVLLGIASVSRGQNDDPCGKNHYILVSGTQAANTNCALAVAGGGTPPAEPAVKADIGQPNSIAVNGRGDVYISSQNIVYRVDRDGALWRVAGTGDPGYTGDGGPATEALLNTPSSYPQMEKDPIDFGPMVGSISLDQAGNLYIADYYNSRVRVVDLQGIITTVIGDGTSCESCGAAVGEVATLRIKWPQGVAVDSAQSLYVAGAYGALWKVTAEGAVSLLAQNDCAHLLAPGLCLPEQFAVDDAGNVFVPDGYCRVREVESNGTIVTIAGDDTHPDGLGWAFTCGNAQDNAPAIGAPLGDMPYGVAVDHDGNLYIADTTNHCVRKVDGAGMLTTIVGLCGTTANPQDDMGGRGPPQQPGDVRLNNPRGVTLDSAGNVYVADSGHGRVLRVTPDGVVTTIAGYLSDYGW